jgi:hypothetical protein
MDAKGLSLTRLASPDSLALIRAASEVGWRLVWEVGDVRKGREADKYSRLQRRAFKRKNKRDAR